MTEPETEKLINRYKLIIKNRHENQKKQAALIRQQTLQAQQYALATPAAKSRAGRTRLRLGAIAGVSRLVNQRAYEAQVDEDGMPIASRVNESRTAREVTSRRTRLRLRLNAQSEAEQQQLKYEHLDQQSRLQLLLAEERTWDKVKVTKIQESKPVARYFNNKIRKIVYSGNYWSAPLKLPAPAHKHRSHTRLLDDLHSDSESDEGTPTSLYSDSVSWSNLFKPIDKKLTSVADLQHIYNHRSALDLDYIINNHHKENLHQVLEESKDHKPSHSHHSHLADKVDIMAYLDHTTLHKIKSEFYAKDKALNLQEFVDVMTRYLPVQIIGEVRLAATLCQFFQDVDVNGDGTMVWSEFSSFIIDAGMNMGDVARADSVEEYRKSNVVDTNKHDNRIEKIFYFDKLDHLMVLERQSNKFEVHNAKNMFQIAQVAGHTSECLSAEFIDKYNWVATSSNDRTIRFWDPFDCYMPINHVINTDDTAIAMRWYSANDILFTATDNNLIQAWKFSKNNSLFANNYKNEYQSEITGTFIGHDDVVLDLLVLDGMGALASASMDKNIILWDINTHQQHDTLRGHKKGVNSLAYHSEYHILVSGAFEHNATVWNPYCAKKICKLKGHYNPLIGVQTVPNSPQILTADGGGIIKVWDIRNFGCVQTIYVEDEKETRVDDLTCFVSVPAHRRLISASTKLHLHDSLTSSSFHSPSIADLEPSKRALYNSQSGSFITASGGTIKIWNAENGILERVYRNLNDCEITSLCLDDSQKKFITGDVKGSIKVYNYLNGSLMKSVDNQNAREITSLEYVRGQKNIIATAWDGAICLYDETDDEDMPLIKRAKHHKTEITTSAFSSNLTLFATGGAEGHVYLWDYRSHVLGGELLGHKSEITALCFLDPYPVLVSADNEGNVCFWLVRPVIVNVGKCALRILNVNKRPERTNSASTKVPMPVSGMNDGSIIDYDSKTNTQYDDTSLHCPVTALAFWEGGESALLYTGDVSGSIKAWDIRRALDRWGLQPFISSEQAAYIQATQENNNYNSQPSKDNKENSNPTSKRTSIISSSDTSKPLLSINPTTDTHILANPATANNPDTAATVAAKSDIDSEALILPIKSSHLPSHTAAARSRQNDYIEYRRVHKNIIVNIENQARKRQHILQQDDIRLCKWWIAHTEAIRDITLLYDITALNNPHTQTNSTQTPTNNNSSSNNPILTNIHPSYIHNNIIGMISCSFDKKVCIWDTNGNNIGNLQQGRTHLRKPQPEWNFPYDLHARISNNQTLAMRVLSQIQGGRGYSRGGNNSNTNNTDTAVTVRPKSKYTRKHAASHHNDSMGAQKKNYITAILARSYDDDDVDSELDSEYSDLSDTESDSEDSNHIYNNINDNNSNLDILKQGGMGGSTHHKNKKSIRLKIEDLLGPNPGSNNNNNSSSRNSGSSTVRGTTAQRIQSARTLVANAGLLQYTGTQNNNSTVSGSQTARVSSGTASNNNNTNDNGSTFITQMHNQSSIAPVRPTPPVSARKSNRSTRVQRAKS